MQDYWTFWIIRLYLYWHKLLQLIFFLVLPQLGCTTIQRSIPLGYLLCLLIQRHQGPLMFFSAVLTAEKVAGVWDKGLWGTTMVDIQAFLEALVQNCQTLDYFPQRLSIRIFGVWASRLKKFYCIHACMHTHMHKMDMYLLDYKRPGRSGLSTLLYSFISFVVMTTKPSHLQRHYPWKKERKTK